MAHRVGGCRRRAAPSRRRTTLTLHEVGPGETPTLFELGIPVVSHAGAWHIDVHQKVPLARSRDAATPAYLRAVHAAVLDTAADLLSAQGAKAPWVTAALADTQTGDAPRRRPYGLR